MQTWSIFIFCYNEAATVARVAESVHQTLRRISPSRSEMIIVDDGSTDGSVEVIRGLEQKYPGLKTIYHERNLGIGAALRHGYEAAACENVVGVPADGQFDLGELLPHPEVPEKTILSFYRLENTSYSAFRNALSWCNYRINKWFTGLNLRDVNWVKVYKTAELKKLDLQMRSSIIESEICAKLLLRGFRAVEVKSVYHRRTAGKSKGASLKMIVQAAIETNKLIGEVRRYRRTLKKEGAR